MTKVLGTHVWPKRLPELTAEQRRISDDFMRYWHERLSAGIAYRAIESFNHGYPVRTAPKEFLRTLEIGCGLGEHLRYENLSSEQRKNYHGLELREGMAAELRRRAPGIQIEIGDCQKRLDFPDGYFDRILAIHVLEHLPDLPAAVREMHRLCNKESGTFSVVIPCEGGSMYGIGRRLSARKIFERRYGQSYDWFIDREHINSPAELFSVLGRYFRIGKRDYYPFKLPSVNLNLCIGMTLHPAKVADEELEPAQDNYSFSPRSG